MLDLDEALAARARARSSPSTSPARRAPVRLLGPPVALSRTPADGTRPGPALGGDTDAVLAALGYDADAVERLKAAGAVAGPGRRRRRGASWHERRPGLKMSELADASGVSAGTIKHYLREGLLGDEDGIVRTSRNMAWYPPEYVDRIRLIKRLQEERFLPLRLIKELLAERPPRTPRDAVELPADVLDRLAELGVLTPDDDGYDPDDVAVIARDRPLPRRRLRRGARLHGLRHAALPRRAAPARREGGRGARRAARGDRPGARGGDRPRGPRAAARADRRDALEDAARGAAPRHQRTRWRSMTPQPARSGPATGSAPANVPNGCS